MDGDPIPDIDHANLSCETASAEHAGPATEDTGLRVKAKGSWTK